MPLFDNRFERGGNGNAGVKGGKLTFAAERANGRLREDFSMD